jgi:outer membrane lipase/esterase
MSPKKRILSALVTTALAAAGATAAQAQQFTNVYVFGDSLSDAGYYRPVLAAAGVPAPLVATLGRFTTNPGPIWSELIVSRYAGTPRASNVSGGTIFAQGGARVALPSPSTPPGHPQRPVSTQITEYLTAVSNAADPNALYAVWGGGNDFLVGFAQLSAGAITAAEFQANVLAAATAEVQQVGRLRAAGARYILVFALPDIGITPALAGAGAANQAAATALSAGYNTTLFSGLAGAGIRAIPVDVFTLISEIRANASAYGITNTTGMACAPLPPFSSTPNSQFCYSANLVAPNADMTYLFADSVHPTTGAHRIVGDFVKSLIEGPAQMSLLPESAIGLRNGHVRTLWDGGTDGYKSEVGKFSVFVAGEGGDYDIDPAAGTVGVGNSNSLMTVGFTARASEAFVVGAAYGKSKAKATFGANAGSYEAIDETLSAFGSVRLPQGFSAAAALTIGDLDYNKTRRNIALGQVTRIAESRPQGNNASFYANAAWDFRLGSFTVAPLVAVASQNVEVNSFEESGAGSANLRIGKQQRRSEVWRAGARASFEFGPWTPWVRVTADKERRDDARFVTATPLSVAAGNTYEIPAYMGDTSWVTAQVGVRGNIGQSASWGVIYTKVSGRSGMGEEGFTGSVSIRF